MKQMNQYRTPRERVDSDFRFRVESGYAVPGTFADPNGMQNDGYVKFGAPLAMIYSPESTFTDIYGTDEALCRGTLFSDVYFPFDYSSCRGNGGMMR